MNTKRYSELIRLETFEERYKYLQLYGVVGEETFGFDRHLNQTFYKSKEWLSFRRDIIVRDKGCDLGISDREIIGPITIHHIIPITLDDILNRRLEKLLNPENAICTCDITHKAIHYGDERLLILNPIERQKNDTCPWRH